MSQGGAQKPITRAGGITQKDKQKNESSSEDDERPLEEKDFCMALAFLASTRSKDVVTQVGACIVKGDPPVLLGLGYNGMPDGPGFKDSEMKWIKPDKHEYVCHSEMNAITSAFRRQADLSGSTLYTTPSPCAECCKLIHQSKIGNVVWAGEYPEKIKEHMKPIRQQAQREEKFVAVEQYLEPHDKVAAKKYEGEQKVMVYFEGNIHCKTLSGLTESRGGPGQPQKTESQKGSGQPGRRDVDLSKDDFFMAIAKLAYNQSTGRTKVGACLVTVDPHRAISIGYSEGYKPNSYRAEDDTYKMEICAESNAIMSAFRVHANLSSSVLYITSPMCHHCAKITVQSGVKTVIYLPSDHEEPNKAVEEIFYRARIPYLKYQRQTKKRCIEIDLRKCEVYLKD